MNIKIGARVKYQNHYLHYKSLGDKHPKAGIEIREVIIVALSKNTDYKNSDYIVCRPEHYPITDLRPSSYAKHWGIGKEQIIEVIGPSTNVRG